mgnify:CR=1 FL=1
MTKVRPRYKVILAIIVTLNIFILYSVGYIFVPDMVFVPEMPAPTVVTSSFWFEYLIYLLAKIMPAWVVQRLLLLAIFGMIFFSAQRLMKLILNIDADIKEKNIQTKDKSLKIKETFFAKSKKCGSSSNTSMDTSKSVLPGNVATRLSSVWQRAASKASNHSQSSDVASRLESVRVQARGTERNVQKLRRVSTKGFGGEMAKNVYGLVAIFGAALYLLNPYVYVRFITGQWAVLMGYALLPLILLATLKLLKNPVRKSWLTLGGLLALMGILSIHYLGIALIMTFIIFGWWLLDNRRERTKTKPVAKSWLMAHVSWLMLSSYWLLPLALGKSKTAETISSFGSSDLAAYATTGDGVGIFGNLLRLQGFWGDNANLYLLPQDTHAWWWIPLVVLFYLVIKGAFWAYKNQRFYFKIFASLFMVGLVVGAGTKAPLVGWFNQLLVDYVPLFGGYREPQKFAGLIALSYCYFGATGVLAITQGNKSVISSQLSVVSSTRLRKTDYGKQKTSGSALPPDSSFRFSKIVSFSLLLPILLVPDLWFNAGGQLKTGDYPAGWYNVKEVVDYENKQGNKVLYLPWHLYMPFEFSGGVVANPAPKFMGRPAVSSANPELGELDRSVRNASAEDFEQTLLPDLKTKPDLAEELRRDSIEYVVLLKEFDWQRFDHFDNRPGFETMYQDESIALYKVNN